MSPAHACVTQHLCRVHRIETFYFVPRACVSNANKLNATVARKRTYGGNAAAHMSSYRVATVGAFVCALLNAVCVEYMC